MVNGEWNGELTAKLYHMRGLKQSVGLDIVPKSTYFQCRQQQEAAMATITALGIGAAFPKAELGMLVDDLLLNTMFGIRVDGKILLIDCGHTTSLALSLAGVDPSRVEVAFLTHQHLDHFGGLVYLALVESAWREPPQRARLLGADMLPNKTWEHSLQGELGFLHGEGRVYLDRYFRVGTTSPRRPFAWRGVQMRPVRVVHNRHLGETFPVHGLRIWVPGGKKVFVSADTQFTPKLLRRHWEWADLIFQDARGGPVHASIEELATLDKRIKAKMRLVHVTQEQWESAYDPRDDGFAGYGKQRESISLT